MFIRMSQTVFFSFDRGST